MSRRRIRRAVQAAIVVASLANSHPARAEVAVGASFGYTHLRYSYSDDPGFHPASDVVAITGAEEWHQPGMRVGYIAPGRRWDLNADFGLTYRTGTNLYRETVFEILPQFQVNARERSGTAHS